MASRNAVAAKQDEAGSLRRERMRAILVEASLKLFAKQGVDATTIDEIVNVAGVAKGIVSATACVTHAASSARCIAACIVCLQLLQGAVTDGLRYSAGSCCNLHKL